MSLKLFCSNFTSVDVVSLQPEGSFIIKVRVCGSPVSPLLPLLRVRGVLGVVAVRETLFICGTDRRHRSISLIDY